MRLKPSKLENLVSRYIFSEDPVRTYIESETLQQNWPDVPPPDARSTYQLYLRIEKELEAHIWR